MLVRDLVNSCSNVHVAEAAVVSIGGAFARRVRAEAARTGLRPGAWAADAVRRFRSDARPADLDRLQQALYGEDQPVLHGLRLIVEPVLAAPVDEGAARA